ncbi:hypothetical protein [Bradyrhizobium sp. STM 3557]|uniref:hypothetical protein n=1 Tax=Bradyrhizobium sp. STM 3557 TaxID=578920 RepID=UPI00388D361C
MADKADDAIALWQQMVGEMQKGFRTFGSQLSGGSSDRTPAGSDSVQKRLAALMESYFEGMNLPSRAQLNGISDRLEAIESKLTDIKALLQEAVTNSKPALGTAQPRQEAHQPAQETPQPPQEAPEPAQAAALPQPPQEAPQPQALRPPGSRSKRPPQAKSQPVPAGKGTSAVPKDADKPK